MRSYFGPNGTRPPAYLLWPSAVALLAAGCREEAGGEPTWAKVLIILVAVVWPLGMMVYGFLSMGKTFGGVFKRRREERRLGRVGRPARAVVLAVAESSAGSTITVNYQPYLYLTLEVHADGRAPYVVSFDAAVPRAVLPRVQPGAALPVLVDPDEPARVAVAWDNMA